MAHRWLYLPDLQSSTGWVTHDADHEPDGPTADAIGFRVAQRPVDDDADLRQTRPDRARSRREIVPKCAKRL